MMSTRKATLLLAATCAALLGCGETETLEDAPATTSTLEVMTTPAVAAPAPTTPTPTPAPAAEPFGPFAFTEEEMRDYLGYSDAEFALLTELERDVYLPEFTPMTVAFTRDIRDDFAAKREVALREATPRFVVERDFDLPIDPALSPPTLTITETESPYPNFTVSNVPDNGAIMLEVDSDPEFRSIGLVRFPSLASYTTEQDLVSRNSAGFQVYQARRPGWPEADTPFRLPFRSTAMALPTNDADFGTMARFAQLVGHGLAHDDVIREIFELVSLRIDHGGASVGRPPIETFLAGIDECGHVNDLAGVLLEMNGIRYRGVSGFNPWIRTLMPGAGHSAIEVLNADGEWEYLDAFLGLYTPGESARDLSDRAADTPFMWQTPETLRGKLDLGESTNVGDLFGYRTYFDKKMRVPITRVPALLDMEDDFGRTIPISQLADDETFVPDRDLPESATLYVRARYVVSDICTVRVRQACGDYDAKASPWVTESFTIAPRKLLDASKTN